MNVLLIQTHSKQAEKGLGTIPGGFRIDGKQYPLRSVEYESLSLPKEGIIEFRYVAELQVVICLHAICNTNGDSTTRGLLTRTVLTRMNFQFSSNCSRKPVRKLKNTVSLTCSLMVGYAFAGVLSPNH